MAKTVNTHFVAPQDRAKLLIAGYYCNKIEAYKQLLNFSLNFIRLLCLSCMYVSMISNVHSSFLLR